MAEFKAYPKIPRLFRDMVITEKLDGTNACIVFEEDGTMSTQSRKRLITPAQDNFGFAAWAWSRRPVLFDALGPGYHYGEWYGQGIQRTYGLDEKRFALFNVGRWEGVDLPAGVETVPVLKRWTFDLDVVNETVEHLRELGSVAVPGFDNPEGIIVYHTAAGQIFKVTLDNDELPKGVANG